MKNWFFLSALIFGCAKTPTPFKLVPQQSSSKELLIGLHALSDQVVWACGTGGTVLFTQDGGENWIPFIYKQADTLQFRDIHAWDENKVALMSAGKVKLHKSSCLTGQIALGM